MGVMGGDDFWEVARVGFDFRVERGRSFLSTLMAIDIADGFCALQHSYGALGER